MSDDKPAPLVAHQIQDQISINVGDVCNTLHVAAKSLLEKEVTSASLNAACNAASQIANLVKVHLEAKRLMARLK
jgi:hypothetical protein